MNEIQKVFNYNITQKIDKKYRFIKSESYDLLEGRARCKLSVRLQNLKKRLEDAGVTKTKINKVNKLDIIESEIRLKEIYTAIVKEMAIKYVA